MRLLQAFFLNTAFICLASGQTYTVSTLAGGILHPSALSATSSIGSPVGVAVDTAGNVYFASYNCIFKLDRSGGLTRIAGNYTLGFSGDGGPATAAQLSLPGQNAGIAVDTPGNVYIPDTVAGIRKISPSGIITSVAIHSGKLRSPNHLAIDASGNIYVAESFGGLVDRVSLTGVVTTVAGGGLSSPASSGPATGVFLTGPTGVALDSAGNLYFADYNQVYKVSPDGSLTNVAGVHSAYYVPPSDSGDGGPATSAQVFGPCELAVDGAGSLYIGTSGLHVRKVSPDGIVTTIAGNGDWGYSGDGGAATNAPVAPHGLAVDSASAGNLYIADFGANRIRKVSPAGNIATAAGDGSYGYAGDGGPATSAELSLPGAVVVDKAGNLYVADIGNNRVRKISPDGTITTVAGNGNPGHAGDGVPAASAEVMPLSLALDSAGNLYILDAHSLRKVSPDGTITTVPGTLVQPSPNNPPSPGTVAPFALSIGRYKPSNGLAVDSAGNLYTEGAPAIGLDKIAPDGTITELLSDHYYPAAIAMDSHGNLDWVSDYIDGIQVISSAGQSGSLPGFGSLQSTLGNGCNPGLTNYYSSYQGAALATDTAGNLYASNGGSPIHKYLPDGTSYLIDVGNIPINTMAVDALGNIYAADTFNNVIRVLKPAIAIPSVAAVTNAASNASGPIAPGEIVAIYGEGLGPTALFSCQYGAAGLIDTQLNGTQVLFNGTPAPLLYASANQVAALVPYAISGNTAQVTIAYQGQTSAAVSVPVAASTPGLFTWDGTGRGQAAAVNQDGSINGASHPAKTGGFISLYATGEGQTSPSGVDGKLASNPLPQPVLPVTVTVGGQAAKVQYAGGAPGYLAGLMQINVQIPAGVAPGNAVPVAIRIGGAAGQSGVTIAVAGN